MPKAPRDEPNVQGASRADAILLGAARVFSAKGFAAASMREVAQASGASLGSIYHHFENKDDILRAIICENFRRVAGSVEERLKGVREPRQQLELFVENHVEFFARHLDEMRVMSHELDSLAGEAGEEVVKLRRAYTQVARDILRRLRPDLSRSDLQVATLSLFGMLNWTYRWFHTLPQGTDAAALGRRMAALFVDGFAG
jgi:TetR/AcrR family transcriptional regulator